MSWTAAVVTVSDRCAAGAADDVSGRWLIARLADLPADVTVRRVVPDDSDAIRDAAMQALTTSIAIFTGGTGLGPRDLTPQSLRPFLDYEIPGLAEAMRAAGLRTTPTAMLSRQLAGVAGRCLVLALPGSERAVAESIDAVWASLPHALDVLSGETAH